MGRTGAHAGDRRARGPGAAHPGQVAARHRAGGIRGYPGGFQ